MSYNPVSSAFPHPDTLLPGSKGLQVPTSLATVTPSDVTLPSGECPAELPP